MGNRWTRPSREKRIEAELRFTGVSFWGLLWTRSEGEDGGNLRLESSFERRDRGGRSNIVRRGEYRENLRATPFAFRKS